jgi:cupin fold WbuC family metalloprotein
MEFIPIEKAKTPSFRVNSDLFVLDNDTFKFLKENAISHKSKKARICLHKKDSDKVNEMIICTYKGAYIRPHMHLKKSESYHVIEGTFSLIFFNDDGKITKVFNAKKDNIIKVPFALWHTMVVTSKACIMHEVTNGPFDSGNTIFADWSPSEFEEKVVIDKYLDSLKSN